jgi:hypothetical protein
VILAKLATFVVAPVVSNTTEPRAVALADVFVSAGVAKVCAGVVSTAELAMPPHPLSNVFPRIRLKASALQSFRRSILNITTPIYMNDSSAE